MAVQADDERDGGLQILEGGDETVGDLVTAGDAAEDVEEHGLHVVVAQDELDGLLHLGSVGAAAGVEEVAGSPPC